MKKKPTRITDVHDVQNEEYTRPFRVEDERILFEDIDSLEKERVSAIKGMGSFAKKALLVLGLLFSILIIGAIYDTVLSASSMMENLPILGILYLLMIFSLVGILLFAGVKQYLGYIKIKRIDYFQEKGKLLYMHPSKEVYVYVKEIVNQYKMHDDKIVRQQAKELEVELDALMDDEVLERLDEKLLAPLDEKVREIIVKYANQTALSTAISPVALIDAVLILSRAHVMVHDIAKVYGYRPNILGEIALFKKVFAALAFASVTDILANHSHDILGTSILSKLSMHGAQGVANGILMARVGLGAQQSCRPLQHAGRSEGFLKGLSKLIVENLFSKNR